MKRSYLFILLVLYMVLDLGYTFVQTYQLPLEGDLPSIVLPDAACTPVLHDPFGLSALLYDEVYVAPNRFFAHAAMVSYFKTMPFFLQRFVDPISSVYAACAVFDTAVQALLLYVLGVYISGTYNLRQLKLWIAMCLLAPLFQIAGFNGQMGIIDHSITYTFFYAFPLTMLLLLLLPFYRAAWRQEPLQLGWPNRLALVALMVVLAFNGAIITGVVAVLGFGVLLYWLQKQQTDGPSGPVQWLARIRQIPRLPFVLLGIFVALCLYSLYIGLNEKEGISHDLPLWQRYARIPSGIFWQLYEPGLPILIVAGLANFWLLRRLRKQLPEVQGTQRILRIMTWMVWFAVVYILLLPLGGYRTYRPLILRHDSIMPLILGLMFCYALSAFFLLHHLPAQTRRLYLGGVLLLSAFYIGTDSLWLEQNNECERHNMEWLAQAQESTVRLSTECTLMSWWKIDNPQYSETNALMLEYWGITKGKKLYYHKGL